MGWSMKSTSKFSYFKLSLIIVLIMIEIKHEEELKPYGLEGEIDI